MSVRRLWVGLDVGDTQSQLCAIDSKEDVVLECLVATDPAAVLEALQTLSRCKVERMALEASSLSIHLIRHLTAAGLKVVCYESRQASRYLRVRLNKTDANDARGLAEIARREPGSLSTVHTKNQENQRMRSKLAFRHTLTRHRVASESMMRALIRLNGGKLRSSRTTALFERNVLEELSRMKRDLDVDLSDEILPLMKLTISMRAYLSELDTSLQNWVKQHHVCSKLIEVPGVGPISAISFYTAIDDPHRFKRPVDVGPYLGLTPVVHQSGKTLKHGRISKRGSKLTRSHLTLGASSLLNVGADGPLKTWGKAVADRAGRGKARVAVARKLAVMMLAIWQRGTRYEPDYAETHLSPSLGSSGNSISTRAVQSADAAQPPAAEAVPPGEAV